MNVRRNSARLACRLVCTGAAADDAWRARGAASLRSTIRPTSSSIARAETSGGPERCEDDHAANAWTTRTIRSGRSRFAES